MLKLIMIVMKIKFKQLWWNWSQLLWKESLKSDGETGHDCYERKVLAVMVKLIMIVMKRKLK